MSTFGEFTSLPQLQWTTVPSHERSRQFSPRSESISNCYAALSRLSRSFTSGTPAEWVAELTTNLHGVLPFDALQVQVYEGDSGEVQWRSQVSESECPEGAPMEESLFRSIYQGQRPIWISDCEIDHGCGASRQRPNGLNSWVRSFCGLPMNTPSRRLGVLALASMRPNSFTLEDVDFLSQVVGQLGLAIDNWLTHDCLKRLQEKIAEETVLPDEDCHRKGALSGIVGRSESLRRVLKQVEIVASTNSNVLIVGETGTGKESVARAIHDLSSRRQNAFVTLNCAAIPTGLLESELFGHEKGAFTGAISQRIGRFELANRGTMFLDEVGEVSLELQPKLLRVLQEREFERLGNGRTLKSEARLVAATNRDLKAMVEDQKFRADLFYRLNVFPIQVPPLRERPEDIPLLARHFVRQFSGQMNRKIETIPSETMEGLVRYHWPGNIRELQNVIERAVILSSGSVLKVPAQDLCELPVKGDGSAQSRSPQSRTLREVERAQILATLNQTRWIVSGPGGAAARLGLNRSTLQFRMKKLGIYRPGTY